ncbi:sugar MFS transporter [Chryseobacterium sp. RP-3-3]|uniref:Sugar MFS transporter n=1 Tax=Chryseobacterium antibioticum TaxID=2728847 RepID=A0A7Y0AR91_9FLAO|nr:MFS transporter [Chryseobacterium antibioticum]NML72039.1 sugar MFS transporter [Chryseobacterium antibioticum]
MKNQSYVLPIAMMFALFFMIAFVTGLQNPMGVIVKNQFQASNFLSQLGNFANFLAYAFMGIPAGFMLQKIGYKKTALIAILVGILGVVIIFLSGKIESFSVYLIGAFIGGFSMCMLNTVVNPMLNTLGGGGKKGNQLLQFGGTLNSMGATIVPVLVGYLMGDVAKATISEANPALFLAIGIFALAFIVLYSINIPESHIDTEKSSVKNTRRPISFRHFTLGAIAIFVYMGIEVGIPNIANLYMTGELQINAATAGTVVGTYWFLMLIGRLTGGVLASKFSSKAMLTFASLLGLVFVLLAILLPKDQVISMPVFQTDISFGFTKVPICIMFLILCGLCTSVMWGGIFNLATKGLGIYTATASGIIMVMVCGGGIMPVFQGYIADILGYLQSYWVIALEILYILFYALVGSNSSQVLIQNL